MANNKHIVVLPSMFAQTTVDRSDPTIVQKVISVSGLFFSGWIRLDPGVGPHHHTKHGRAKGSQKERVWNIIMELFRPPFPFPSPLLVVCGVWERERARQVATMKFKVQSMVKISSSRVGVCLQPPVDRSILLDNIYHHSDIRKLPSIADVALADTSDSSSRQPSQLLIMLGRS